VVLNGIGGYSPLFRGYGCEEEFFSIRAWLCGYSVRLIGDLLIEHRYRESGHPEEESWERAFNRHVAAGTLFANGIYESCYRERLIRGNPDPEVMRRLDECSLYVTRLRQGLQSRRRVRDSDLAALCGVSHPEPISN
jgi:hypothetical protein